VYSPAFESILARIRNHNFEDNSSKGLADFNDDAWRVRTLVVRDLVRLGPGGIKMLRTGLYDKNRHVRQVCAKTLGILGARKAGDDLIKLALEDSDKVVRLQAAESLGQIGYKKAKAVLKKISQEDQNRNVRHVAELSLERLKTKDVSGPEDIKAWASLDAKTFRTAKVGGKAPDFELKDTKGKIRRLSDYKGQTVVLIWIWADWCRICHREFHYLLELEKEFKEANIAVLTLECHDMFRTKVMDEGHDIWGPFLKERGSKKLEGIMDSVLNRKKLWWPHLSDSAGAVAAMYGADPMVFTAHDEWINRPSTIIVDEKGIVRFAYYGTYWGDRPTIKETLEMIKTNTYKFVHPGRKKIKN
ncbi:MAG: HEAT repeat domain-containing protein, partial [Planctomycetota bacterium]